MKKLFALVLSCTLAGAAFAAPAKKAAKTAKAPAKAEFIVVESDTYAAGKEDPQLTAGIAGFLGVEPKVTKLTLAQAAQDAKLAGFDYSFLPLYIIKKTNDIRQKLGQHIQYGVAIEKEEYILLPKQTNQGVYTNKTAQPKVMDLFVMSQCPYGVMAENRIIQAKKDGKLADDKNIRVRYVVSYNEKDGFSSLHGSGEWEEDIRQLLIAKYYPSKFWKYLEIRNKDYRSSRWDKAMEEAGVNVKKIMKKFDTEGVELLKQEAKYASEYGINASPSFVWEGQVKLDFGGVAALEGFGFMNPNAAAGNNNAVPAGSC